MIDSTTGYCSIIASDKPHYSLQNIPHPPAPTTTMRIVSFPFVIFERSSNGGRGADLGGVCVWFEIGCWGGVVVDDLVEVGNRWINMY